MRFKAYSRTDVPNENRKWLKCLLAVRHGAPSQIYVA
jgi:hypothetical protein